MPVDFLSDEQVSRYRRFRDEVTVDALTSKRRPAIKLGWAVQWGTARMLGTFLPDTPLKVPSEVVESGLRPFHEPAAAQD